MKNKPGWEWQPDTVTIAAIKRGQLKVAAFNRQLKEDLLNFNLAVRTRVSKQELDRRAEERTAVRAYLERRLNDGEKKIHGGGSKCQSKLAVISNNGSTNIDVPGGRGSKRSLRRTIGSVLSEADKRRTSTKLQRYRRRGLHLIESNRSSEPSAQGGSMNGAVLVLLEKGKTRPLAKYVSTELALQAGEHEPDARSARDWTVVSNGSILKSFTAAELDALYTQSPGVVVNAEPENEVVRERKEARILSWFTGMEPVADRLSDEALKHQQRRPKEDAGSVSEQTNVTEETTVANVTPVKPAKKKVPKKALKKALKKVAKKPVEKATAKKGPTAAKAKSKVNDGSKKKDGLGREGTPARFIRERLLAGDDPTAIFNKAVKKFPDHDIKDPSYVRYYKHDLVKRGLWR